MSFVSAVSLDSDLRVVVPPSRHALERELILRARWHERVTEDRYHAVYTLFVSLHEAKILEIAVLANVQMYGVRCNEEERVRGWGVKLFATVSVVFHSLREILIVRTCLRIARIFASPA